MSDTTQQYQPPQFQSFEHSEQIDQIAGALAAAQLEIEGASKDSVNPHFNRNYADMSSVWDACHKQLNKNGIAIVQIPTFREGGHVLCTKLVHKSGQWFAGEYPVAPVKNDPQGFGSAMTYARRYSLMAMAGVAPMDDDGNAGSLPPQQQARPANQAPAAAPKKTVFGTVADDCDTFPADVAGIRRELNGFAGKKFAEIDDAALAALERHMVDLTGKASNENKIVLATLAALTKNEIGRRVKASTEQK